MNNSTNRWFAANSRTTFTPEVQGQRWPDGRRSGLAAGHLRFSVLGILLALAAGQSCLAQSGRYYVTDESGFNSVWQFQGGALVSSFPTVPAGGADGPILVDGNTNEVRSVKGGFNGGFAAGSPAPGSEYDFAGVVQGPLSLDFTAHPGYGRVIDAAFDGSNAYIVAGLFGNAGVFRYNSDFSGPGTLVFNLFGPAQETTQGITYDTSTNTIWTSDYDFNATATGGRVRQWSLAGVELFSFPVIDNAGVASGRNTALAYDPSDDTFWMNATLKVRWDLDSVNCGRSTARGTSCRVFTVSRQWPRLHPTSSIGAVKSSSYPNRPPPCYPLPASSRWSRVCVEDGVAKTGLCYRSAFLESGDPAPLFFYAGVRKE